MSAETLIFGASSQIGEPLLPLLSANGHRLIAVSRRPTANRPGVRWQAGGFSEISHAPPTVISLGPLSDFSHWFDAIEGVERVIAVGSVSLRHKRSSAAGEERRVADLLDQSEQRLRHRSEAIGARLTLLRPCLLYGAGRDHTVAPALRFARERGWLPAPMTASGLRQPLHVADLAEAIKQCVEGAAVGQTLELGGAERLSLAQILAHIADSVPGCRLRRFPTLPLRWAGAMLSPWSASARRVHRALLRSADDQLADETVTSGCLDWRPGSFAPTRRADEPR